MNSSTLSAASEKPIFFEISGARVSDSCLCWDAPSVLISLRCMRRIPDQKISPVGADVNAIAILNRQSSNWISTSRRYLALQLRLQTQSASSKPAINCWTVPAKLQCCHKQSFVIKMLVSLLLFIPILFFSPFLCAVERGRLYINFRCHWRRNCTKLPNVTFVLPVRSEKNAACSV